jgi:hypothetical protein
MYSVLISSLRTLNQLLTAGIAITAFSLLMYALSFNLRDRVARSFAVILACVVVVFVSDAIGSVSASPRELYFWLRIQWVGIVFLPAAYLHFSDAILATTGRPSRGRRRLIVRISYLISIAFLLLLPFSLLVGPLVQNKAPAPHLERTSFTLIFTLFYTGSMLVAGANFFRAYQRTVTTASRRRMGYLLVGALAPALGSFPYMLFGSGLAERHQLIFWIAATISNLLVSVFLIIMAYAVAFFGVSWPDRVIKRRLFKWLMRGPVTASTVLAITTVIRRLEPAFGLNYPAVIPILMVAIIVVMEHLITLAAPVWERWLFHGGDRDDIQLLQNLEERMLTRGDLRQYLESVLAAVCDRLQAKAAFVTALGENGLDILVTIGENKSLAKEDLSADLLEDVSNSTMREELYAWGDYWLVPLNDQRQENSPMLGLLGVLHTSGQAIDEEQGEALAILAERAAMALVDRRAQQQVFTSLEALTPEVELIQSLRAATSYRGEESVSEVLTRGVLPAEIDQGDLSGWVKDALTHYWGGPRLTQSPLIKLRVVQQAMDDHDGNPTNALRAILRQAIEQVRPEGERRFTGEWILYNILELKFLEGHKVREVAMRLAVSEADLYRKQRVAIEAVAEAIIEMEKQAIDHEPVSIGLNT